MRVHSLLRLSESIDVGEHDQIVKFVETRKRSSLPNTTLGELTITCDAEYSVVDFIKVLAGVRHASCNGKTLA